MATTRGEHAGEKAILTLTTGEPQFRRGSGYYTLRLEAHVVRENNEPVKDVFITFTGDGKKLADRKTGDDGKAYFFWQELDPGTYPITAKTDSGLGVEDETTIMPSQTAASQQQQTRYQQQQPKGKRDQQDDDSSQGGRKKGQPPILTITDPTKVELVKKGTSFFVPVRFVVKLGNKPANGAQARIILDNQQVEDLQLVDSQGALEMDVKIPNEAGRKFKLYAHAVHQDQDIQVYLGAVTVPAEKKKLEATVSESADKVAIGLLLTEANGQPTGGKIVAWAFENEGDTEQKQLVWDILSEGAYTVVRPRFQGPQKITFFLQSDPSVKVKTIEILGRAQVQASTASGTQDRYKAARERGKQRYLAEKAAVAENKKFRLGNWLSKKFGKERS